MHVRRTSNSDSLGRATCHPVLMTLPLACTLADLPSRCRTASGVRSWASPEALHFPQRPRMHSIAPRPRSHPQQHTPSRGAPPRPCCLTRSSARSHPRGAISSPLSSAPSSAHALRGTMPRPPRPNRTARTGSSRLRGPFPSSSSGRSPGARQVSPSCGSWTVFVGRHATRRRPHPVRPHNMRCSRQRIDGALASLALLPSAAAELKR